MKYWIILCLLLSGCATYDCVGIENHNSENWDTGFVEVCEDSSGKRTYEGTVYDQADLDDTFDTFKLWVENGCPKVMEIKNTL